MIADNLAPEIWNAIAREIERNANPREIFFAIVTKRDSDKKLIWVDDFGSLAIPLVGFQRTFSYLDTVVDSVDTGTGAPSAHAAWRGDKTQVNDAYNTQIVVPQVGQIVVILDMWAAKRFPICLGVIQSSAGYWQGEVSD